MERRRGKRLSVNLKAERLSCSRNCSVFIENISDTGIQMITAPAKNPKVFVPGAPVELRLETAEGNPIKLNCLVKWSYDSSREDMTNSVGLEVIDPPDEYLSLVKNLHK
ncbi:MAG: PilZ domain-containing protein [Nitrospiraceae bacterium]|nr:MAG: PilZ domain-containing protein [Nitrospiraceae bacterium]